MTRVALSWAAWAVVLSLLVSAAASGQPFPNRPIRVIVPFEAAPE
jgi:tripartite-type tricarboxylate transporter receptor subunit TctC